MSRKIMVRFLRLFIMLNVLPQEAGRKGAAGGNLRSPAAGLARTEEGARAASR